MKRKYILMAAVSVVLLTSNMAYARDQIRIVGSSTVYPFATVVAEQFGRDTNFKTPVVESTGTGGGFKLFCEGTGIDTPDISNASRAIKSSEVETCKKNGVLSIKEVTIGYDGIVVAQSKTAQPLNLTTKDLFVALAKKIPGADGKLYDNPNKTWRDVRSDLPNIKIEVLGPPPTSGTRDAFAELALESGAETFSSLKELKSTDKKAFEAIAFGVREDGAYIEAGENDVLIVRKLEANKNALGIFGYSFLDQNREKVRGININGAEPSFENIADAKYVLSRPLFFYVKNAHTDEVSGIKEYIDLFVKMANDDGILADKGLIPLPPKLQTTMIKTIQ